ncbi:VOC family protein [Nocardioides sp.]|uniref:bleomycin resistance protein n=1 Tax=Nocardioides sp. TaxID=35761 RepID=UPI002726F717|nr:VOC family protein [Nocardioides sp.]MDO9454877.1 VOC family protein [Nocardioides sp.]
MPLDRTIPALPVVSVARAVEAYVDRLGFEVVHLDPNGFAIVARDAAEIHLWQSSDEGWRLRPAEDVADCPVRTGAEDFISGTASCRISCSDVAEVDALHAELAAAGALHPTDGGAPVDTEWGTREFAALDLDGNLLTFFVWTRPR